MISDMRSVSGYLQEVKEVISHPENEHEGWVLVPRQENRDCITQLCLKIKGIADIILGLSATDYVEGPCKDRDMPGDIWIFGKQVDELEIYIKLKLAIFGPIRRVRIISFHPAEDILIYPYRD